VSRSQRRRNDSRRRDSPADGRQRHRFEFNRAGARGRRQTVAPKGEKLRTGTRRRKQYRGPEPVPSPEFHATPPRRQRRWPPSQAIPCRRAQGRGASRRPACRDRAASCPHHHGLNAHDGIIALPQNPVKASRRSLRQRQRSPIFCCCLGLSIGMSHAGTFGNLRISRRYFTSSSFSAFSHVSS
jgi:hypothetical protein